MNSHQDESHEPMCSLRPCQRETFVLRVSAVEKLLEGWRPVRIGSERITGPVIDFGDCNGGCTSK